MRWMRDLLLPLILPFLFVGWAESSRPTTLTVGLEDSTHPTKTGSNDVRLSRNMVNTVDHNIPADWSIQEGAQKNIKWSVKIGTQRTGYLLPAIAGGKVVIATNNTVPSDPKVTGNKALLK